MAKDKNRRKEKHEIYDAGDLGEVSTYNLKNFVQEPYIDYATGEVVDESIIRHRPTHKLGDLEGYEVNAEALVGLYVRILKTYISIEELIETFQKDAAFRFVLARAFEKAGYSISPNKDYSLSSETWGPNFPIKAPRLWVDRDKRTETNPADFVRSVYAEWLPHLARQDLLRLDKPLYVSYAQWVRPERHPEDKIDFDAGYGSARIKNPIDAIERRRASGRAATARLRERRKTGQNVAGSDSANVTTLSCKLPSPE